MRREVWVLLIVLAVASDARSQTTVLKAVTFDDAIAGAIARNPTVAQATTAIARAEAILQQTRAATRPSVTTRLSSVTVDTAVGFESGVVQPRHQVAWGGTASVPLLAPARWAAIAQARDQIDITTRATTEARQQIAVATAQAYLAVITTRRQVVVEERALENAGAHLAFAQARFEGGVGSRLNMLRAAQQATEGEARLESSRLARRQAQEALGVLLAEDGPIDTAGEPAFDVPSSIDDPAWMNARPDLMTQQTVVRAAERVVRDSWKDIAPSVTASFDPLYIAPTGLFQPARTWRFSIAVTQPLFQGGVQRAVTRQREAALDASRIALTDIEIRARSEVRLAQASLSSRERTLTSARQAAEQTDEVLSITTSAFEVGASTNIEVIDAQRSARDAGTAVALAQDALERARLELLVAIGQFP